MEIEIKDATDLFVGKTIAKMDASCDNNIQFLFTDGSRITLHVDCNGFGLPDVFACTDCATVTADA